MRDSSGQVTGQVEVLEITGSVQVGTGRRPSKLSPYFSLISGRYVEEEEEVGVEREES